jgi:hypothetical protein
MYSAGISLSVSNSIFIDLSSNGYSPIISHRSNNGIRNISFDRCELSNINTSSSESLLNFVNYNTDSSTLRIENNEFYNIKVPEESEINGGVININLKFLSIKLNNNEFKEISGSGTGGAIYLKFIFIFIFFLFIYLFYYFLVFQIWMK